MVIPLLCGQPEVPEAVTVSLCHFVVKWVRVAWPPSFHNCSTQPSISPVPQFPLCSAGAMELLLTKGEKNHVLDVLGS